MVPISFNNYYHPTENTSVNDRPLYGYIPKIKKNIKGYRKLEWMHNFYKGQGLSKEGVTPWVKTANYSNPPLTHQFKLWNGSPSLKVP